MDSMTKLEEAEEGMEGRLTKLEKDISTEVGDMRPRPACSRCARYRTKWQIGALSKRCRVLSGRVISPRCFLPR